MAILVDQKIRFRHDGAGTARYRVRIHAANSVPAAATPFDEVAIAAAPVQATGEHAGYRLIPLSLVPKAAGLEGAFDIAITAVDVAGNESDFLDIDNATFDQSPPAVPTDGALVG
jgi:hypothetical protein